MWRGGSPGHFTLDNKDNKSEEYTSEALSQEALEDSRKLTSTKAGIFPETGVARLIRSQLQARLA